MSLPPLSPEQLIKPRHFELRLSAIFALLLIPGAVHIPYFPLWLEEQGFGASEIAVILSAPMFLRVMTTPFITAFADKAKDRVNVLVTLVVSSLLLSLGYFLPPTYLIVLGVSLVLAVVWTPQASIADSLALSGVRRYGSVYANMRIWGSISYFCMNFIGGVMLAAIGTGMVPVIITGGFVISLGAVLLAPRIGRPRRASPLSAAEIAISSAALRDRSFLYLMAGQGIIIASHALLYGFASIYWKSVGVGETLSGALWAWAVVSEVGTFIIFHRVFAHVPGRTLFAIAGVTAMVRWLVFPFIFPLGLGVPGFFGIQTLHALSTGLVILAVQKVISESIPEERIGAAQGIAYFTNGFSMAAVTLLCGPLYAWYGGHAFLFMAGIAATGLVFVGLAGRSTPQRALGR